MFAPSDRKVTGFRNRKTRWSDPVQPEKKTRRKHNATRKRGRKASQRPPKPVPTVRELARDGYVSKDAARTSLFFGSVRRAFNDGSDASSHANVRARLETSMRGMAEARVQEAARESEALVRQITELERTLSGILGDSVGQTIDDVVPEEGTLVRHCRPWEQRRVRAAQRSLDEKRRRLAFLRSSKVHEATQRLLEPASLVLSTLPPGRAPVSLVRSLTVVCDDKRASGASVFDWAEMHVRLVTPVVRTLRRPTKAQQHRQTLAQRARNDQASARASARAVRAAAFAAQASSPAVRARLDALAAPPARSARGQDALMAMVRSCKWTYPAGSYVTLVNDMNTCACGGIMTVNPASGFLVCVLCRRGPDGLHVTSTNMDGSFGEATQTRTYDREGYSRKRWDKMQGKKYHFIPVELLLKLCALLHRDAVPMRDIIKWKVLRKYLTELGDNKGFYDWVPLISAALTGVWNPRSDETFERETVCMMNEIENVYRAHFKDANKSSSKNSLNVLMRCFLCAYMRGHAELRPFLPGLDNSKSLNKKNATIEKIFRALDWEFTPITKMPSGVFPEEVYDRFFPSWPDLLRWARRQKRAVDAAKKKRTADATRGKGV